METCFRDAGPGDGLFAGLCRISEKEEKDFRDTLLVHPCSAPAAS
jgi:hypothetical protein